MSFFHIAKKGGVIEKKGGSKKGGPFFSWRIDCSFLFEGDFTVNCLQPLNVLNPKRNCIFKLNLSYTFPDLID